MSLTTNEAILPYRRLGQALDCLLRPAVGFHTPFDVLKDPFLDVAEKRAILASWASDASSVEGRPAWRWLLGTDEPVPLTDVLEALWRLDGGNFAQAEGTPEANRLRRRRRNVRRVSARRPFRASANINPSAAPRT